MTHASCAKDITSNTKIKDVSALKDCTGLEILNLENDKGIKGYEEITSLANLNISNCDIKDVQELSNLKELVEVNLSLQLLALLDIV